MYSANYDRLHKVLLKITYVMGFSPIFYDGGVNKYKISQTGFVKAFLSLIYLVMYISFICPTNVYLLVKNRDYPNTIFTAITFLSCLVGVVILGNLMYHCDDICRFWNGYANYIKQVEGKKSIV